MTEIFLFNHPPYCLLDLVRSILIFFFLKSGAILTITNAANYVCSEVCQSCEELWKKGFLCKRVWEMLHSFSAP